MKPSLDVLTELANASAIAFSREWGVYNPDKITFEQYSRMREHPVVSLGLTVISNVVLSTEARVECENEDVKAFVEATYLDTPLRRKFYKGALTSLVYGYAALEKCYRFEGGRWVYDDFRNPEARVVRYIADDKGGYNGFIESARSRDIFVPPEKSVWVVFQEEHGNLYGRSLLKPIYKTCYDLFLNELFANRCMERFGAPYILVFYPPDTPGDSTNAAAAADIASGIKNASEITVPVLYDERGNALWRVEVAEPRGDVEGFESFLMYKNRQLLRGMAVPDRVLLEGEGGARSEAEDKSGWFSQVIDGYVADFISYENDHVIRPLVEYNFGRVGCRLVAERRADEKREFMKDVIMTVIQQGASADAQLLASVKRILEGYGFSGLSEGGE